MAFSQIVAFFVDGFSSFGSFSQIGSGTHHNPICTPWERWQLYSCSADLCEAQMYVCKALCPTEHVLSAPILKRESKLWHSRFTPKFWSMSHFENSAHKLVDNRCQHCSTTQSASASLESCCFISVILPPFQCEIMTITDQLLQQGGESG